MRASSVGLDALAARIARFSRHAVSIATSASLGSASSGAALPGSCCTTDCSHERTSLDGRLQHKASDIQKRGSCMLSGDEAL